jgi:putative transposase
MNPPRATDQDYIEFLLATPRVATATEAARVQPNRPNAPAHDAFTRLEPEPAVLWEEVRPLVRRTGGVLVFDDTVLDIQDNVFFASNATMRPSRIAQVPVRFSV